MPLLDIFRKDSKYWSHDELAEVELFFTLAPFFSPYYEHQDLQTVTGFTFYAKIWPKEEFTLTNNRQSEIMILLSGEI